MPASRRARRLRWLVPVAVAAALGLLAFLPTLSSASTPDLPAISAEQLIAKVKQSNVQAFSGKFELTANLGLPNLSDVQGAVGQSGAGFNPIDLLSGTHSATIAVDGPDRQRLSMPGSLNEVDAFHDGQNAWLWESDGHTVTHYILPADKPDANEPNDHPENPTPTPEDLAKQLLDQITPSTNVSVTTPAYVADRAVYELVLAPHAAESTVDHVGIAVDAANGMPLQVQVVAKGQSKPAIELGFTSIDYGKPSGSFSFTPPPGATVTTKDLTKKDDNEGGSFGAAPARPIELHRFHHATWGVTMDPMQPPGLRVMTVLGQDWTQIVVADGGLPMRGWGLRDATTPVSGSWGSGRLLHTALVNVLVLPDEGIGAESQTGTVYAGFVNASALEAAAGQAVHVGG